VFLSGKFYYYKLIHGETQYKFRAIEKPFSIDNPDNIIERFKQAVIDSDSPYFFDIAVPVRNEAGLKEVQFTFHNKRQLLFKNNEFKLTPWNIKPQRFRAIVP